MSYQIKLLEPVFKGTLNGNSGYYVNGMRVITTDEQEHQVPLSGFYYCTAEEKAAADEEMRDRMIVEGAEDELDQVATALNWLAQRYEDGKVKGIQQALLEEDPTIETVEIPGIEVTPEPEAEPAPEEEEDEEPEE